MADAPAPLAERLDTLAAAVHHRGDRGAFDKLGTLVRPRLLALLRPRLHPPDDADDVAQQALLRAWEKRDAYTPGRPFLPWLYTIALRLAADHRRAAGRRQRHEQHAARPSHTQSHPDQPLLQSEHQQRVWQTVRDTLGPDADAATALWLFYAEGFTAPQIAEALGKKPGAVRTMLHRGREALRGPLRSLQEDGPAAQAVQADRTPTPRSASDASPHPQLSTIPPNPFPGAQL